MSETANLLFEYDNILHDGRIILNEFNKPIQLNVFFNNKLYLIQNSDLIEFNVGKWEYSPQTFSYDQYTIPEFYPLILMVNNLKSIFEFKYENLLNKIITPTPLAISHVMRLSRI